LREIVGGELGGDATPAEGAARADHRHRRGRVAPEHAQQIGQQGDRRQPGEHDRDQQIPGGLRRVRRGRQTRADHTEHDRAHCQVLVAPGVLPEHPLGEEHQHQQTGGERRLYDDQRRQQQGHDLEWPAEDRQAGAEQPARPPDQVLGKRQAQVLLWGRLLGLHRLERDP
jgi:hypothetical protein